LGTWKDRLETARSLDCPQCGAPAFVVTEQGTRHLTGDEVDLDEIVDKAEAGDLEIDIDHTDDCPAQSDWNE
jgi:hypothetical protein